jgi:hypothetical protein
MLLCASYRAIPLKCVFGAIISLYTLGGQYGNITKSADLWRGFIWFLRFFILRNTSGATVQSPFAVVCRNTAAGIEPTKTTKGGKRLN